jgi:hypothetical protein
VPDEVRLLVAAGSSSTTTLALTGRLIGVVLLVQSAELFVRRGSYGRRGAWSWALLRREHAARTPLVRRVLDAVFGDRGLAAVGLLRVVAGVVLVVAPTTATPWRDVFGVVGFVASVLVSMRARGRENGASDAMVNLVLLGLASAGLARCLGGDVDDAAVAFVAAQALWSYGAAGLAKLRSPAWRAGGALADFVVEPRFGVPRSIRAVIVRPLVGRPLSWATVGWQLATPLAVASPTVCVVLGALGLVFHVGNFVAFGLNRFLLAWLAAWPAVFWCSTRIAAPAMGSW